MNIRARRWFQALAVGTAALGLAASPATTAPQIASSLSDALRPKIVAAISAGNWQEVLRLTGDFRLVGVPPASLDYIEGKALLRTGKPGAAVEKLEAYLRNTGKDGSFYRQANAAWVEAQLGSTVAQAIKDRSWQNVLHLSREYRMLGGKPPASLNYIEGKALLRTGKPKAAMAKFDFYLWSEGAEGSFYEQARAARAEAEQAVIAKGPSRRWIAKARSSGILIREVSVTAQKHASTYLILVTGRYPTKNGVNKIEPAIAVLTWAVKWKTLGVEMPESRKIIRGRWNPGQEFTFSLEVPLSYVDGPDKITLEFCIGTETVCVDGPSFGPKT